MIRPHYLFEAEIEDLSERDLPGKRKNKLELQ